MALNFKLQAILYSFSETYNFLIFLQVSNVIQQSRTHHHKYSMNNIIESLLVKHLGSYIDGLKNSLDIGLFDGEISIENVSLKPTFINQLGLPFTLKFSHIEKIHIHIPWTSLKEKNTIVTVKGIYVLLNISYQQIQHEINIEQILKSMIQGIKAQMKKKWIQPSSKQQTFAEKNLIRIVDNLVLNISNIHIRMQSFKRNWDYSIGVIMNDISSYTVDQNEQKKFYHRSFSKKETNLPFKKILNIDVLQVYFNDEEKIFICNEANQSKAYLLKVMAHPFRNGVSQIATSPIKKNTTPEDIKYPHYELKIFTNISMKAVGTQRFSQDLRYLVDVEVDINSIDFKINNKQLSQLIYCSQHFYEYGLNIAKNGRKGYDFNEEVQKNYKNLILKIAKDEKLTSSDRQQLTAIIGKVPVSVLQRINQQTINGYRFELQIKKISKVSNVEKSKKLMLQLQQKKKKMQSMQGVQIFQQVVIESRINKMTLGLFGGGGVQIMQFGLMGMDLKVSMNLQGTTVLNLQILNMYIICGGKEITKDHFDTTKNMLTLELQLNKQELNILNLQILKKEISITEEHLLSFLELIQMIRIRPPLLNYIDQQMNYSIDITRIMIDFLIKSQRDINIRIHLPIFNLSLSHRINVMMNLGCMLGSSRKEHTEFIWQWIEGIDIHLNNKLCIDIDRGNSIVMMNRDKLVNYQKIAINLTKFKIVDPQEIFKVLNLLFKNEFMRKYQQLSLIDHTTEEELDGQFYLNKLQPQFTAKITKYELIFLPKHLHGHFQPQKISLIRTKIYKLRHQDRYYIVFKEQVKKEVNIIQASSLKMMQTIFIKLKDKIQQMSTAFQWQKYYKQFYQENITSLQEIQDVNLQNDVLMKLEVNLSLFIINIYEGIKLELSGFTSQISYHEFNTQAALQFQQLQLEVDQEKIIYNVNFTGNYHYLQTMNIQLSIHQFNYQINLFSTIQKIIAAISYYELFYLELQSSKKKVAYSMVEENQNRLIGIKSQNSRTDNINKFLLQKKISVVLQKIQGMVIGYLNRFQFIKFDLQKYRNERHPRLQTSFKGILIFSMVSIPSILFKFTPTLIHLHVESINIQLPMATIIYEIVKGQGSIIVKSIIKAIRNRKIAEKEYKDAQKNMKEQELGNDQRKGVSEVKKRDVAMKIDEIHLQMHLTDYLKVGINMKDLQLQNNKFLWNHTLFWLNNDCISLAENNGILKIDHNNIDICMTNFKLKLNSKEIIFLVFQLKKVYAFFKNNNFDVIQFVQEELFQPDNKGRIMQRKNKIFSIRVQELQIIYECTDKNPLLSIRFKPLFFTNYNQFNTINLSIWNLNRILKLYQPIIEPFQMKIIKKQQSQHFQILLDDFLIIITEQLILDCLNQAKLLCQLYTQLMRDQSNEFQEMTTHDIQLNKERILQQHFQYYQEQTFKENIQYNCQLKIINYLSCQCIIEISCNKKNKQQLHFHNNFGEISSQVIYISQKTSYQHSYELIQRYQQVHLKVCMLGNYHARTTHLSFLLYDQDNHYIQPIQIVDSNGLEMNSSIALKVNYTEGIYLLEIISAYTLVNTLNYPLYFRYADKYSINKFKLQENENIRLPPWTIDYVTFGLTENSYNHVLMLRCNEGQQTSGFFQLQIKNKDNEKLCLVVHKEKILHKKKQKPILYYLQEKSNEEKVIEQFQSARSKTNDNNTQAKQQEQIEACIFTYKIIPGIIVSNHIHFPITINDHLFQYNHPQQLFFLYRDGDKEFIKLSLGDRSFHEIYIPEVNEPLQVNLKVTDDNFVTVILNVRRNKLKQRIIHIYSEINVLINIPNLSQPTIITNIYQHNFIVKKEVKNNYSDKIHPSPILKDKFIFNSYHYLLSLEQKYVSFKLSNKVSNQIILYESDYNKDLVLKSKQGILDEIIYSVSYLSNLIHLENDEQNMKLQHIETYYAYIMPKYYLINRSQGTFVINGHVLFRNGQKITIENIKYLDMNVRDQMDFKYIPNDINKSPFLLFIKGEEKKSSEEEDRQIMEEIEINKRVSRVNALYMDQFQPPFLRNITQISEPSAEATQSNITNATQFLPTELEEEDQQNQQPSLVKGAKHIIKMSQLYVFAVSKRLCEYNTVCFQIQDWTEWFQTKNELKHRVVLKTMITDDIAGIQIVEPGETASIISGLCDYIQISILFSGKEQIINKFSLNERLNHIISLSHRNTEIHFSEKKVKAGRFMTISAPKEQVHNNINKVNTYISLRINRMNISLILFEQKQRKEFLRINLNEIKLLFMKYKNGLYMVNITLQILQLMFKRLTLVLISELKVYVEGIEKEFIERLEIETKNQIQIGLNDQLIVSLLLKFQELYQRVPTNINFINEEVISQEEATFHINSLKISPIIIKFSLRKIISDMNQNKAKLLSKLSLSIVEVEDAKIQLSAVIIQTPLRQRHINGINKMYTMESFIGIASGLNILGNIAQFNNEFQAGRNRTGFVPFFRSLVAGTSNSVSKIIGTIGSSVSELTFDREFMKQRIQNKNIRVQGFGMGLKVGLKQIAHSLKSCIQGLVEQPMEGYREEGTQGALKGTVAGLTGLITKPLTGLILASSKIIEGINSSTTLLDFKIIEEQQLLGRPLYHKFKLVRPYKSQEQLGYNILVNWYNYTDVELVSSFLLENEEGDSIVQILIITCSELILIDLESKEIKLKLRIEELLATGKFTEGVVLYYQKGESEEDQDEIVFRLQNYAQNRQNLYWTLKGFISLYAQKQA